MTGLHSPWGMLGKIKDTRGYTPNEVLWGDSWINILMEAADAPRYVTGTRPAPVVKSKEELDEILGRR